MNIFKNLYNYRELLKTSVKKDVRAASHVMRHECCGNLSQINVASIIEMG